MAPMHPLLRDLQHEIANLRNKRIKKPITEKITDANPSVTSFCKTLESIFQHGMLQEETKGQYFAAIEALALEERRDQGLNALVRHVVSEIRKIRSLRTNVGRGRYFLRCCLNHGWINSLVMSMRSWKGIDQWYYSDALLLRNPSDSIMELLPILQLIHFDLNLANRTFLDDSWDLPVYKTFELVPCSDLGLMICSMDGRIIVTRVKPGSIAGEDGKVGVGDVIEDVDATPTFGLAPEHVALLVKRCARRPISIGVVKAEGRGGKVYEPLQRSLADVGINLKDLEVNWERKRYRRCKLQGKDLFGDEDDEVHEFADGEDEFDPLLDDEEDDEIIRKVTKVKGGHELLYIGSLKIGSVGDSGMLDKAISRVRSDQKKVHHSVTLHLQELGVKLFSNESGNMVLDYTYPEISACGCSSTDFHYMAFIAGNDLCPLATEYMCHVFYCVSQAKARGIITTIAEGFQRTRNAV